MCKIAPDANCENDKKRFRQKLIAKIEAKGDK